LARIKTLLFGMTGLGNAVLDSLVRCDRIDLNAVLTSKRLLNPYPYYECEPLYKLAEKLGVPVYEGLNIKESSTFELIESLNPQLIVVSTFDQIITQNIIRLPQYGVINVHPSLLPFYRGATPTVWVLLNGEEVTGVSVHFIEDEKIDSGRIILQSELRILSADTDGSLRMRLADLARHTIVEAIELILIKSKDHFPLQDESRATYFPRRTLKDAQINVNQSLNEINNKIRSMTPYPGAYIIKNNSRYLIKSVKLLSNTEQLSSGNNFFDLEIKDGRARFFSEGIING